MDGRERLRVLLELDPGGGELLSGRIGTGNDLREFSGWLSLMAALENVRAIDAGARSPPAVPEAGTATELQAGGDG